MSKIKDFKSNSFYFALKNTSGFESHWSLTLSLVSWRQGVFLVWGPAFKDKGRIYDAVCPYRNIKKNQWYKNEWDLQPQFKVRGAHVDLLQEGNSDWSSTNVLYCPLC